MVFEQRVKMSDVARTAGVSVATVSKVVNGRYGVAQATVERVQQVIHELGYEASLGAQSLRSHRTNVLGILVAEFEPFSTELLKGASREVAGSGYQLLAYSSGDGEGAAIGWERRSLARLSGTLIDGAVIVTPTVVETKHGFHVVAVDPHTGPSGLPTVDSDNFAGAVLATDHLLSLGHRRIAHISGRPDLESARLREAGFRKAMADAGVPVDEQLVRVGGFRTETAASTAAELLALPDRPTAIFAGNDLSAISTVDVARGLGLGVPDDLSVIGFDNIPESALVDPPLTTIRQPLQRMGAESLRLLIDLIAGVERDTHIQLPTELVVRASCRPLR
ncbi:MULTISPECIES: LacI family DNA-binding transcriptional regulator [Micromonospora]|uniref:LacI family transcriptional regulator n=1 Tax=Micromonospora tulbaghiae TaxID=479978 RepID=A0A386WI32_9ACTN|nr:MULTISPECIES: LacI family DNA-binding transcriptional regulator [Micromonospora]AYF27149.1 LacI family transcriptional regulator [Micromonospora tulbaghiae]MCO1613516.1 LacI family transcriptional regulator [Micromonospora sp. CPM1]NED51323.1 LacI family transcriptional regulator [Micromonospora aurantiaca]RLQ06710.1 LacI family DNA-binding transcriptional regulator [Micromonospora sp. BL1]